MGTEIWFMPLLHGVLGGHGQLTPSDTLLCASFSPLASTGGLEIGDMPRSQEPVAPTAQAGFWGGGVLGVVLAVLSP